MERVTRETCGALRQTRAREPKGRHGERERGRKRVVEGKGAQSGPAFGNRPLGQV